MDSQTSTVSSPSQTQTDHNTPETETSALKTTCTIYVTDVPSSGSDRKIKELREKFEDINNFLDKRSKDASNLSVFRPQVEDACRKGKLDSPVDVYVWESKGKWYYSASIQKDWLNKREIKQLFKK